MTIIEDMKNQIYPRRFGEDRIIRQGEHLVICSKVDMDDWQIRGTRKTAILIDDEIWCLVGKQFSATNEIHYILEPYSDYLSQLPGRRIRYDEDYVRDRAEVDKKRKTEARSEPFLYPFRWFIGFLPSHRKAAIEKKYGLPARNATSGSITVEFVLCVLLGHFWWVSILFGPLVVPVYLTTVILLIDIVFRYGSYFREDASPYGFLEWFFVFLHRKLLHKPAGDGSATNVDPAFPYR